KLNDIVRINDIWRLVYKRFVVFEHLNRVYAWQSRVRSVPEFPYVNFDIFQAPLILVVHVVKNLCECIMMNMTFFRSMTDSSNIELKTLTYPPHAEHSVKMLTVS